MSTGLIITLIVAAVAVLALVLLFSGRMGGRQSVKRRFGPEYERTVAQHGGDTKAAERELRERLRRHGDVRQRPLAPQERERYAARWAAVQERFVESPVEAVVEADRLLDRLTEARGFPGDGFDERVSALSVHHPRRVQGYREVHAVAVLAREGQADTERLREALVHARALYEDLVEPSADDRADDRADKHVGGRPHGVDGSPDGSPDGHRGHDGSRLDGEPRHHGRLAEKLHVTRAAHRHDAPRRSA
ncbi:hypothetical protein F0L17_06750 [Streptomyces sp. TRM43335]|uniref:Secreted protein n=1 Tax=Streptomyces taklimakanensis TaxID=2569853 RepID=A0A6G2B9A6_9ACTN|nr:hypothetical protein [Streptomyces taklimakanensis]MTE18838.1 hypothetical protein [Streptomyces taklimakanensis]